MICPKCGSDDWRLRNYNTQRRPAGQNARPAGQGSRSAGQTSRTMEGTPRSVVTERTPARNGAPYGQQNGYRGREMSGGRSVTISGDHMAGQDDSDDYEELF